MADLNSLFGKGLRGRLLALRRDLHRHPELAFEEERTAARLYDELAKLDPAELERIAGTGVIARIAGTDDAAPVVALRGDIDALPIQEETGLDYASEAPGVMHACGHDVHATWTVGAAHLLASRPARGDVLILLQPAEETGRGAAAILQTGALDGAAAIFGAHVDRRFPVGQVVAQAGPLAAATDEFTIELLGSGGHGARPHEAADPVVGASALIMAMQTIVARRLRPGTPAVVTIGMLRAGTAPNVIPDTAELRGTLRSIEPETRELLQREVERIVQRVAVAHDLQPRITFERGTPPLVNPPGPVEWAQRAARSLLGEEALVTLPTINMGGEDFAFYLERLAGCFLRVGAREEGGEVMPAHSPRFVAADESIFVGAAVLAETARLAAENLMERSDPRR
ncbi:MAG: amidohydrolase [Gemmatimonadota bacterium]|nr:MAG: amidohydrolase [Gemmatimonadota bacterium]